LQASYRQFFLGSGFPDFGDRITDLKREVGFSSAEDLGGVLVEPVRLGMFSHALHDPFCTVDGDLLDLGAVHVEHNTTKSGCTGVIEVDHGLLSPCCGLDRALNQFGSGLREGDDGDVVRDAVFVDQGTHKIIICLGRGRKADLDFFKTDLDQHLKETELALNAHGFDQ